jgi:REP-associated tyrosine transposase
MSRPLRVEFPGAVYHVMARGNERRAVFRDRADRLDYLVRLGSYASGLSFRVYAYCLMTNHVHLAIETGRVALSRIMLALHGSYTQSFNRRHRRVGHLFQGRYKALLVDRDEHLLTLVRYIHLNPVQAHIVPRPQDFEWSSDRAYRGSEAPAWLTTSVALASFAPSRRAALKAYEAFMGDESKTRYEDIETYAQLVKGDEQFAIRVAAAHKPEIIRRALTPEQVVRAVIQARGNEDGSLHSFSSRIRGITGYVGREVAQIPLVRFAELFRRHDGTIVRDVRRVEDQLRTDEGLRKEVDSVLEAISLAGMQR